MEDLATRIEYHADGIMRAAGSSLKHYTEYSRRRILAAMCDAFEEAMKRGALVAQKQIEERN